MASRTEVWRNSDRIELVGLTATVLVLNWSTSLCCSREWRHTSVSVGALPSANHDMWSLSTSPSPPPRLPASPPFLPLHHPEERGRLEGFIWGAPMVGRVVGLLCSALEYVQRHNHDVHMDLSAAATATAAVVASAIGSPTVSVVA